MNAIWLIVNSYINSILRILFRNALINANWNYMTQMRRRSINPSLAEPSKHWWPVGSCWIFGVVTLLSRVFVHLSLLSAITGHTDNADDFQFNVIFILVIMLILRDKIIVIAALLTLVFFFQHVTAKLREKRFLTFPRTSPTRLQVSLHFWSISIGTEFEKIFSPS